MKCLPHQSCVGAWRTEAEEGQRDLTRALDRDAGQSESAVGAEARRQCLATKSHLVEGLGQGPRVVTHERVNSLPDGLVRSENLLQGRAPQGCIGRDRKGGLQELIVELLNSKQVSQAEHGEGSGKDRQRLADGGLGRTGERDSGSRTDRLVLSFEKLAEELAVRTRTAHVLICKGICFGGAVAPRHPQRGARSMC